MAHDPVRHPAGKCKSAPGRFVPEGDGAQGCRSFHGSAGLGLRRVFIEALQAAPPDNVGFYEIAPENWMHIGGKAGKLFRSLTEQFPFVCHGLCLSVGGPAPLDETFLLALKAFMAEHGMALYSEHLSYCGDDGHLYDLMPLPFTEAAVHHAAARIRRVQDVLERRIAMENISYYAAPGQEMAEIDFLKAVLAEADCDLLLDVNNIYVNSINHGYDAEAFLKAIPAERIAYLHIAGHYVEAEDFIVDTHGAPIVHPVWELLDRTYQCFGVQPTLLERDFNIPPLDELLAEVDCIRALQKRREANA
ncbi:MAG: DUF692 domain-containing protein [Methylococcaceae bacterium]|nr:MAG: DUF692 domain-containing protein [Methylococcaceae bacterium]